jgi:large subunit ribosomal protein L32e
MVKFLRRTYNRYSKLGLRKKKKQVWRSPKGRHNKMREKRRGYSPVVSIGYGTNKKTRGKILDKNPVIVNNINELIRLHKNDVAIIGKMGKKKKIEMAKEAKKRNIFIFNFKVDKFLMKNSPKVDREDKK